MAWKLSQPKKKAKLASHVGSASEASLPKVTRDYYLEHPDVAALTDEEANRIRQSLDIKTYGDGCPKPVANFVQASFPQYVLDALASASFVTPTAIQRQAWPVAMSGHDLVGLAETGSGKTLAYLLPALVHVNAQPMPQDGDGPLALVLAPTRELAMQIYEESVRFGHPCGVRTACVVGGLPRGPQVQALRKAPEVVVATPGRLNDHLSAKRTELSHCIYVVIDEADRMLDLGFEPQIRQLSTYMRADRQTLLFSATWPQEVASLAERLLLPRYLTVEVGGALTAGGRANARISQHCHVVEESAKTATLVALLEETMDEGVHVLVFCGSRRRCEDLTRALRVDGWPALALHGDKAQEERDWVLQQFKTGSNPILVATDVAQRGLDIKQVRLVVNFDCPSSAEAYVHRIGRTGRAGADGTAHTLLTSEDARVAEELVAVLRGAGQPVASELERLAAAAPRRRGQPQKTTAPVDIRPLWLTEQYGEASTAGAPEAADADAEEDGGILAAVPPAAEAPLLTPATAATIDEPDAPPASAVFVHFIPPPLRANNKRDLAWIVHTCDGSGCREASHVQFNSICGFSTFEGAPPEQAQGIACNCTIANHHLRGFGKVRWENNLAIIEHHGIGSGGDPMVNVRAWKEEARKHGSQLARAREELKKLRDLGTSASRQIDDLVRARDDQEASQVREQAVGRSKQKALDDKHRALAIKYDALKAEHEQLVARTAPSAEAARKAAAAAEAERQRRAAEAAAAAAAADEERAASEVQINLGCWKAVLVCLPPTPASPATRKA